MFKTLFFATLASYLLLPLHAQEAAAPYESAQPKALLVHYEQAMAKLSFLKGEWQPQASAFNPKTGSWESREMTSDLGDKVIITPLEEVRGLAISIPGVTNYTGSLSYDVFQNMYRLVINDSAFGLLDVYEGQFQNQQLVLTNLNSNTFFTSQEVTYHGRLVFKADGDSGWTLKVEMSPDGGKSWLEAYRLHTRPIS